MTASAVHQASSSGSSEKLVTGLPSFGWGAKGATRRRDDLHYVRVRQRLTQHLLSDRSGRTKQ